MLSLRRVSIDTVVYWGVFLFAAISITYVLVTLVHLSTEEETAFMESTNYRQQIRYVVVKTSMGSFTVAFMRSQAPITTKTFLKLAQSGFYDQTKFYYFPQGVFLESNLAPTSSAGEKNVGHIFQDNVETLNMTRGLVAMPRRDGSKIDGRLILFFTEDDLPVASKEYVAFGRIIEGTEVVDKIREVSPHINAGTLAPVTLASVVVD